MQLLLVGRLVLPILIAAAVPASAAEPGCPPLEVLGRRGAAPYLYGACDSHCARLANVPFTHAQGLAWSLDGRRWAVWGSDAPPAYPSSASLEDLRSPARSLVLGGDGIETRVSSLASLGGPRWKLEDVRLLQWSRRGTRLLIVGRPESDAGALRPASSVCILLDGNGRILHAVSVTGVVRSATSSPDDETWACARAGDPGSAVFLWRPPNAPEVAPLNLPVRGSSTRVAEVGELLWHPFDPDLMAVIYRVAPEDLAWLVAVARRDGSAGRIAVHPQRSIRGVQWSPDGKRLSWISPRERTFVYREHSLAVVYEVLWSAAPGYGPEAAFDVVEQTVFTRPEELTSLAYAPTVESYTWFGDDLVVLARSAGPLLWPTSRLWWVRPRQEPTLLFEDALWRGPIAARPQ